MKWHLKAFKWLYKSFEADNQAKGVLSARKASTFVLIGCAIYAHTWVDSKNATDFLFWDLTGIFTLLGLVTFQDAYKAKNGGNKNTGQD